MVGIPRAHSILSSVSLSSKGLFEWLLADCLCTMGFTSHLILALSDTDFMVDPLWRLEALLSFESSEDALKMSCAIDFHRREALSIDCLASCFSFASATDLLEESVAFFPCWRRTALWFRAWNSFDAFRSKSCAFTMAASAVLPFCSSSSITSFFSLSSSQTKGATRSRLSRANRLRSWLDTTSAFSVSELLSSDADPPPEASELSKLVSPSCISTEFCGEA